jgi:hypothetical protein
MHKSGMSEHWGRGRWLWLVDGALLRHSCAFCPLPLFILTVHFRRWARGYLPQDGDSDFLLILP